MNVSTVMAIAEGIVSARDSSKFMSYKGSIQITKSWGKSLLSQIGYRIAGYFQGCKILRKS